MLNTVISTVTVLLSGESSVAVPSAPGLPVSPARQWAEAIHLWLNAKGWVKTTVPPGPAGRALGDLHGAGLVTGYTVFEYINPVGIVSRALIYGPTVALVWVIFRSASRSFLAPVLMPLRLPDRADLRHHRRVARCG